MPRITKSLKRGSKLFHPHREYRTKKNRRGKNILIKDYKRKKEKLKFKDFEI